MTVIDCQACWGPSPSGGKNSSNKMAKQAALGFVKRTLERCHQFQDTGKSCFNEPLFREMFLAASSQLSIVRQLDDMEAESAKPYSLEARTGFFITPLNKFSNLFYFFSLNCVLYDHFSQCPHIASIVYDMFSVDSNPVSTLPVPNPIIPIK